MVEKINSLKKKIIEFYQHHEVLVSMFVFVFGFLFDIFTLGRIDDLFNLVQQALYLLVLGTLLIVEIRVKIGKKILSARLENFWQYHNLIVHFLFGSLLSVYTIFYYTSASAITSFLFILMLAGLMLANEFPKFQKIGLPIRIILYSICVLSYFSFFYPIMMGKIGPLPFWLGFLSSIAVFFIIWIYNFRGSEQFAILKNNILLPTILVHLFFIVGYYTSLIPPVPVAVKRIGVYYSLEKKDGHYIGTHLNEWWDIWNRGAQNFKARPGDKIHILLAVFSPAKFEEKITLNWYFDDPQQGWTLQDSIPLTIFGGRDQGFRGFGIKSFFQIGKWRVIVNTSDGREVGRVSLTVKNDSNTDERNFKKDLF